MREVSLKSCVPFDDESQSYYALYGDLYFEVPHYVKSYIIEKDSITVKYASDSSMTIWKSN